MSLIKIENLTFSYYGYVKPVFENVSFSFDTNWKTGLIERNSLIPILTCRDLEKVKKELKERL